MCKTDERSGNIIVPTEAEKIGFAKHMTHRLWRTKTKSNTTAFHSCTIAANI